MFQTSFIYKFCAGRQIKDTKAGINSQAFFQQKWTPNWLFVTKNTFVVNGLYFSLWLGQTMLVGLSWFVHEISRLKPVEGRLISFKKMLAENVLRNDI